MSRLQEQIRGFIEKHPDEANQAALEIIQHLDEIELGLSGNGWLEDDPDTPPYQAAPLPLPGAPETEERFWLPLGPLSAETIARFRQYCVQHLFAAHSDKCRIYLETLERLEERPAAEQTAETFYSLLPLPIQQQVIREDEAPCS